MFFILFEIFAGEAGNTASGTNKYVAASFSTMRLIVTVGWSIYPMGYFFGYLMGSVQDATLNLVYNLADFVNKIEFCQEVHSGKGRCTSPLVRSPLYLIDSGIVCTSTSLHRFRQQFSSTCIVMLIFRAFVPFLYCMNLSDLTQVIFPVPGIFAGSFLL